MNEPAGAATVYADVKPKSGNIDAIMAAYLQSIQATPTEYHLGAGGMTFSGLRFLARSPQVAAIIRTRVNQVSEWARPQQHPYGVGFVVSQVDRRDRLSKRVENDIQDVTALLMNGGGKWFQGGFEGFIRAIVRDSLIYDAATFEVVTEDDGKGGRKPIAMVPVDPATIRRAIPANDSEEMEHHRLDFDDVAWVQWLDQKVVAEFTNRELAYGVRNPRSWVYAAGHGHPELEELIFVVSSLINAQASNAANYMTGVHGNLLITLETKMKTNRFATVERLIHAALNGPRQNKKTPIVQLDPTLNEKLTAHNLGTPSNVDMQYADWINFLLKTTASLYGIDPAEIGFIFGTENVKNQQYANSPLDRIISSKERGLRPILRAVAQWLNYWVIQPYWPHLRMDFVGFDMQTSKEQDEADAKAVTLWMTTNEVRASRKPPLPPLDHPAADLPLNALFSAQDAPQPPPIAEYDSLTAWMNGRKVADLAVAA